MIHPRLRPYFSLLNKVRLPFAGAVLCGILYGISSGFGLPTMAQVVFPILFSGSNPEESKEWRAVTSTGGTVPVYWMDGWYIDAPYIESSIPPSPLDFDNLQIHETRPGRVGSDPSQPGRGSQSAFWIRGEDGEMQSITGPFQYRDDSGTWQTASPRGDSLNILSRLQIPHWQLMILAVGLLPLAFAVRGLSSFFNVYLINYTGLRVLEDIRCQLFTKIQNLDITFFTSHSQGDLMSRLFNDTSQLQVSVVNVANDLIKQPVTFLGAMGFLIFKSIEKSEIIFILFSLAIIPVCVLPIRFAGKKLLKRALQMQQQTGKANALVQENLAGYREIRSFNLQNREKSRFLVTIRDLFREQMKIVKYSSFLSPLIEFISAIGISMAIFYAAGKGITLEDFTPLIMALYLSYEPIKKLGTIHNQIKKGVASLDRIEEILHQPEKIVCPQNPSPFPSPLQSLQLDHLHFEYSPGNPVLEGIHFEAFMGQSIALVGPSGAGKSTLAQLLCRFFDPSSGSIRINGVDIREFDPLVLRRQIAMVSQETVLFNDSVENNIRLGNLDASQAEIMAAAQHAQAMEFIDALPEKFQTKLGERGNRLSGGQRQRISIARAFLKDAPIIILDEATSALDAGSEARVQKAMRELVRGRMAWIIAHRLSTVRHADVIMVMDQGKVVDVGSHENLLQTSSLYRQLVNSQSFQEVGTPDEAGTE